MPAIKIGNVYTVMSPPMKAITAIENVSILKKPLAIGVMRLSKK